MDCNTFIKIQPNLTETFYCTINLTDYNTLNGLQETITGTLELKSPGKTLEIPVKILIVQPGGITWLILAIKETQYGFWGAIAVIIASLLIATAGISGFIKNKTVQVITTLGGGSLAAFLIIMLVTI